MLWGVKLYLLQQSRKTRFAPGADAKEVDLNLFILGRKILLDLQASKCCGMRGGGGKGREGGKKMLKSLGTPGENSLSSPVTVCNSRKSSRNTKHVLLPHPAEEVFRSSCFLSSTLLCCCILDSPSPLRKLHRAEVTCSNQLAEQRKCLWLI